MTLTRPLDVCPICNSSVQNYKGVLKCLNRHRLEDEDKTPKAVSK